VMPHAVHGDVDRYEFDHVSGPFTATLPTVCTTEATEVTEVYFSPRLQLS
jgi:hypothetical protein